MQTLTFKKFWIFVSLTSIITTFYLSLRPSSGPHIPVPYFDKYAHFIIYSFLGHYHANLLPQLNKKYLFFFFFTMGISIELLQSLTAHRSCELADMLANGLGIFFGQYILNKYFPRYLIKLDRYFS